jgi:hypothetical protein
MISNIPTFAMHQDYQMRHSDMLAAARRGDLYDPSKPTIQSVIWNSFPQITEIYRGLRINWRPMAGAQQKFFDEPVFIGWDLASGPKNGQP